MKHLLAFACVLIFGLVSVFGQATIRDLRPTHAAALETYLSKNKQNSFRSENIVDRDYVKYMRETYGKNFRPNYVAADLNGDRVVDFAVLLQRTGKPTGEAPDENASSDHFPDYPLTLVVFNGVKGGRFRVAFSENLDGPKAAFINVTTARRKRLYYGVFETDNTFSLVPAGRGYTVRQ